MMLADRSISCISSPAAVFHLRDLSGRELPGAKQPCRGVTAVEARADQESVMLSALIELVQRCVLWISKDWALWLEKAFLLLLQWTAAFCCDRED